MSQLLDQIAILLRTLQYMPGLRLSLLCLAGLLAGLVAGRATRRLRRRPPDPRPRSGQAFRSSPSRR